MTNPTIRVLCVDDEPHLLRTLEVNLTARGYLVDLATTGEEALRLATVNSPDLVLLDLGLPGMSGRLVIQQLRERSDVPIIVLSARDAESTKVGALDDGADDYLTKPFGMGELLARIRVALRRPAAQRARPDIEQTPHFCLNFPARSISTPTGDRRLTPIEWRIVELLVEHRGEVVTSHRLLQEVWGPSYTQETHYLRVHLAHVRQKLEPVAHQPIYFLTEPGVGYRYVPAGVQTGSTPRAEIGDETES